MTIGFILNGEDVIINTEAEHRLIDVLRDSFKLFGAKANCNSGACGLCSVIYNWDVMKSCLIPAFKIRGSEIITIEGFELTDEYRDIIRGFSEAGVVNCGYCNTSKILTVEALLLKNPRPRPADILMAFQGVKCRCTEPESIINGVLEIVDMRQRRLYGNRA